MNDLLLMPLNSNIKEYQTDINLPLKTEEPNKDKNSSKKKVKNSLLNMSITERSSVWLDMRKQHV